MSNFRENIGNEENKIDMLGTIKLPSNLKLLSKKLPESQYEDFSSDEDKKIGGSKQKNNKSSAIDGLDEIEEENELLGQAFNFLGKVAQEATEKADLRSWQTMPGKSHGIVLKLPNGVHTIEIEYLASNGLVLHSEIQEVEVNSQSDLKLIESIYWN